MKLTCRMLQVWLVAGSLPIYHYTHFLHLLVIYFLTSRLISFIILILFLAIILVWASLTLCICSFRIDLIIKGIEWCNLCLYPASYVQGYCVAFAKGKKDTDWFLPTYIRQTYSVSNIHIHQYIQTAYINVTKQWDKNSKGKLKRETWHSNNKT